MKREKMKAEIGELIEELDRERMRQEFYKHLWPKGKWGNGFCSLCGEEAITEWNETGGEVIYTNFCPSCGADMRGNKEEQSSSGPAKILYLCDRRRCDNCSEDCRLTSDIRHAENFIKYNNVFCEKEAAGELIKEEGGKKHGG